MTLLGYLIIYCAISYIIFFISLRNQLPKELEKHPILKGDRIVLIIIGCFWLFSPILLLLGWAYWIFRLITTCLGYMVVGDTIDIKTGDKQ